MIKIIAWLVGSKIGRWSVFALLAAVLVWLALTSASRAGTRAEQAKQAAARIKSLQTALRANNEITNMSADERRTYVARWLSDTGE